MIEFLQTANIKWKFKIKSVCKFTNVGLFNSYVVENLYLYSFFSLKLREIPVQRAGSLVVSDVRSEAKGSRFEPGYKLMCRGDFSAVIAQLMFKCLWSR